MGHCISVKGIEVIEIIDEDLEILIIDLINKEYINIGKISTLNSAIGQIEELKLAKKIWINYRSEKFNLWVGFDKNIKDKNIIYLLPG